MRHVTLDELRVWELARLELDGYVERLSTRSGRAWQVASMHKTVRSYSAVITDPFATFTAYYSNGHWSKQ